MVKNDKPIKPIVDVSKNCGWCGGLGKVVEEKAGGLGWNDCKKGVHPPKNKK